LLRWRIGLDPATAREKVRVARALGNLPAIDAALKSGKLSYAKVRALTRVATPETEAKLLDAALYSTGAQLERLCRGCRTAMSQMTADNALPPPERSVRRRDLSGGMVKLEVILSPDEAALVLTALDRAREVTHPQGKTDVSAEVSAEDPKHPSRADGMVALAESYLAGNVGTGNGGERFQVMVHVDQDPFAPDGVLAGTLDDGTRVSAEAIRRVACDCAIVAGPPAAPAAETPRPATRAEVAASASPRPATRGEVDARSAAGEGLPGRRTRSIPPSIRRALTLRDRGCAFPGCTHDRFLHAHHIQHWLHGGRGHGHPFGASLGRATGTGCARIASGFARTGRGADLRCRGKRRDVVDGRLLARGRRFGSANLSQPGTPVGVARRTDARGSRAHLM
jgi:hypothetical protein